MRKSRLEQAEKAPGGQGMRKTGIHELTSLIALTCLVAAGTAAGAAETTIPVILPLTGNASFLGQGIQRALKVLELTVNKDGGIGGTELHFVFQDDQTSPQVAVQLTNALVAQPPAVMMGSSLVAMCNAMAPLVRNGPVDYCLSPGARPAPGTFMYSTNTSTRDLLLASFHYFKSRGWTRVATISSSDATGQDFEKGVDAALKAAENSGIEIVERARFNQSDLSVAAQLERIKAANPQVLVAWTTGAPVATIFKGIVQADLAIPVVTTNGNQTFEQMEQYAAFLPKELYFPSSLFEPHQGVLALDPQIEAAQKLFYAAMAEAKAPVDIVAAHAWDPGMMLVAALRKIGPGATAPQIKDFLDNLSGYPGINGIYDFKKSPQRGLDIQSTVVTRWDAPGKHWIMVSRPGGEALSN
jgi:branched-chain amino acid transport system substrate-binding protein